LKIQSYKAENYHQRQEKFSINFSRFNLVDAGRKYQSICLTTFKDQSAVTLNPHINTPWVARDNGDFEQAFYSNQIGIISKTCDRLFF
jgi:hypothetical protein